MPMTFLGNSFGFFKNSSETLLFLFHRITVANHRKGIGNQAASPVRASAIASRNLVGISNEFPMHFVRLSSENQGKSLAIPGNS